MINLTERLPKNSGWDVLLRAEGVNDFGQIVGHGLYGGEVRGYVMTIAVPEPTAMAWLGIGFLWLHRANRRLA